MFLDDGISRDSAPDNAFLAASTLAKSKANGTTVTNGTNGTNGHTNGTNGTSGQTNGNTNGHTNGSSASFVDKGVDPKAASKFSKVVITQVCVSSPFPNSPCHLLDSTIFHSNATF